MLKENKLMKIGIVSSAGGHLDDVLSILEAFKDCSVFLVSYDVYTFKNFQYSGIERVYRVKYFGDSVAELFLSLLYSCFAYLKIFLKERPQVIFSTGSEIAIPAFYIGKAVFGTKLIYLETTSRTYKPTYTARFLYWISDLFLVQSKSLLPKFGSKARYAGSAL